MEPRKIGVVEVDVEEEAVHQKKRNNGRENL
jgi:hypothetical protein